MLLIVAILLIVTAVTVFSIAQGSPSGGIPIQSESQYILVGGQNGTWFKRGQAPRLYRILLSDYSVTKLAPVSSEGTVWGGGWNGSQWLISGWGSDDASLGPYVCLYDGMNVVAEGSLDNYGQAGSWSGGDVFSASYNGRHWLLSGLGSDALPGVSKQAFNHMSLGTFDGYHFTDLSALVPRQDDAILYANAWNGKYWLVGGGYGRFRRVLFSFDGAKPTDLTTHAVKSLRTFGPVQAIGWNGRYWLIGGVNFLASYDGRNFVDLTSGLNSRLGADFTVNAMAWDGYEWMLAGGPPVAQLLPGRAWAITYSSFGFADLSQSLPSYVRTQTSSILTLAFTHSSWIFGGYSKLHGGMLLSYQNGAFKDLTQFAKDMSYVTWVGAGVLKGSQQPYPRFAFATSSTIVQCSVSSLVNKNPRRP